MGNTEEKSSSQKALRVLIVGPAHPLRGGLATFDERLCKTFNDLGHHCEILNFSLQYPNILFPGKTQYSDEPAPKDIIINTELNSVNPFNWLAKGLKYKKQNYDFLVFRFWMPFMGPCLGSIARIVKSNKKTKILAIADNLIPHEKRAGDTLLTKYFINTTQALLTMSQSVMHDIDIHFPGKPKAYNPHPMYDSFGPAVSRETALKELNLDPSYRYLLFFGFIRKYKGLDILLESLAKSKYFNNATKKVKVIIAGEFYEDSKPYMDLIEKYNLQEHLILHTDFIQNSKVPNYFCAADMVVQPYHSATQSGVTQIAYYYNVPMLVTDVGGLAELVPHNEVGYVCQPNAEAVATCIDDFFDNNRYDIMKANVEVYKKNFSWNSLVEKLIGLYNNIKP